MRRRTFLAIAGGVTATPGCAGGGGNDDSEADEPDVDVVDSEVFSSAFDPGDDGEEVPWLAADVENGAAVPTTDLRVETRFRDGDGNLLGTRERFTAVLPAETTWRYYSRHEFEMNEEIEPEHAIVHSVAGIQGTLVEEFDVVSLSTDVDGGAVSVVGEIEVEGPEREALVIVPLISDEDGRFRGAFRIHEAGGGPIAFDGGSVGFRTPADRARVDDAELLVVEPDR